MKKIKLTQDKVVLVDDEDFDYLNQFKWCFLNGGYAVRDIGGRKNKKRIYMHRILNNTPEGFDTDHINRNKLDNRKINLRTVTHNVNMQNANLFKNNKSGYKGVWFWKQRNKWQVSIHNNYQKIYLGLFNDIKKAILARQEAERTYWKEDSCGQ